MKKILLILLLLVSFYTSDSFSQLLLEENFSYPAGDSLTAHGWMRHSGSQGQILVVSPGLTYTNYPSSGIGNAARLDTVGASGIDVNRTFVADSSGSVYAAFMVNVSYGTTAGEYFFHIGPFVLGTTFRARVFVRDSANMVSFGLSKGSGTGTYTPYSYSRNITYLVIAKYTFNTGSGTDDAVSLFVFTSPNLPNTEPSPTIGPLTDVSITDLPNAGSAALRQGVQNQRPILVVDGIRITKSWGSIVSSFKKISTIAERFFLHQNYPNPFNPITNIEFELHKPAFVTLKIYNELGGEVTSLVKENLKAGSYRATFSGGNYPSGVYFYKLTAIESSTGQVFTETKSMVLIK